MGTLNLNTPNINPYDDAGIQYIKELRGAPSAVTPEIEVYFDGHEERLVSIINQSDVVVGCVAWLTSKPLLQALAGCNAVSLVVQKEDFLRPDIDGAWTNYKAHLRQLYDALPSGLNGGDIDNRLLGRVNQTGDRAIDAIRCCGLHNREKAPAWPRMHHKFIVLCRYESYLMMDFDGHVGEYPVVAPHTVCTGSFNYTKNATASLENVLIIRQPDIVKAYFDEWARVLALSESLDWTDDWCAPEYRIGT